MDRNHTSCSAHAAPHHSEAIAIKDAVIVSAIYTLGGSYNRSGTYDPLMKVIETECNCFDEYKALPKVIEYAGHVYGKTGWSSDTFRACYKTEVLVARAR